MSDHAMGMDMGAPERAEPFDKAFIDAIVPHHQAAIAMAEADLAKGKQGALRAMAEDIISAETGEIAQMKQWREDWYGSMKALLDMDGHGSASNVGTGG